MRQSNSRKYYLMSSFLLAGRIYRPNCMYFLDLKFLQKTFAPRKLNSLVFPYNVKILLTVIFFMVILLNDKLFALFAQFAFHTDWICCCGCWLLSSPSLPFLVSSSWSWLASVLVLQRRTPVVKNLSNVLTEFQSV